ncbi:MAG: XdhC family protein [Verrucomicrobia bacterium]|nr:XdhC family protein [Verrucomicrobiota bacterium]
MKNRQETEQIFNRLRELSERDCTVALATIIKLDGSAYRRPGAKMLIEEDGGMSGNVSGGCLENDLRENALDAIRSGKSRKVHYDTSGEEDRLWGMGLGCDGAVDIIVRPFKPSTYAALIGEVCERYSGDEPFSLCTVTDPAVTSDFMYVGDIDAEDRDGIFVERVAPAPRVVVIGAGDDAIPLAAYAADSGFRVTLVDHRSAYLTDDRFPCADFVQMRFDDKHDLPLGEHTYVVLKTHAIIHDKAWVKRLVESPAPYIGILGAKKRREEILAEVDPKHHGRIFGPVGLDLGAEGAEQVAVSIVGEILAVRSGRAPGHLRDRTRPIHQ